MKIQIQGIEELPSKPIFRKWYRFWWFGRKRDPISGYWIESDKSFRKRLKLSNI